MSEEGRAPERSGVGEDTERSGAGMESGPGGEPERSARPTPTPDAPTAGGPGGEAARSAAEFRIAGPAVLAVLWPLATIAIEVATRMSAEGYLDPMPTIWHLFLLALVPGAAIYAMVVGCSEWSASRATWAARLVGAGVGVAALYSLVYLPLAPLAVIAIAMMGMGLLPLAPFASLIGLLLLGARLAKRAAAHGASNRVAFLTGLAASCVALVGLELPGWVVAEGVRRAASDDPEVARSGVRMLRRFASEDDLAEALRFPQLTAERSLLPRGARLRGRWFAQGDRARLYYRITGRDLLADTGRGMPTTWGDRPVRQSDGSLMGEFAQAQVRSARRWDSLRGTDVVGPVLPDFALAGCSVDAVVDADAAVAYVEWVMRLANDDPTIQREGRAEILLPTGAAVSRLSLWVDGEEKDAAFAGRARTTEAYRDVAVVRQRDPALVTTKGADRVLLRCFPVPARGEMKLRIGVTVPLELDVDPAAPARFVLPRFAARNFSLARDCTVWVESDGELVAPGDGWSVQPSAGESRTMRGEASADELVELRCAQSAAAGPRWSVDPLDDARIVVQTVEPEVVPPPTRVVVVIDGSRSMRGRRGRLEDAVRAVDAALDPRFVIASEDGAPEVLDRDGALAALDRHDFEGGVDNLPALELAWDAAFDATSAGGGAARGMVLWLHGMQPVQFGGLDGLLQRYRRGRDAPALRAIAMTPGTNRLQDALIGAREVGYRALAVSDPVAFVGGLHQPRRVWSRRFAVTDAPPADAPEVTSHLARLEVLDRVLRGGADREDELRDLAARYRLVTPLTGAVVLEREEQYDRHGLDPTASPRAVPTVPEPGEWALIVLGAAMSWWVARRRRPAIGAAA